MDRPLRPAFIKGLRNEVQIVVTVLSINPDELYDVVAINASSMSTQLSGLPFSGPIGGVRVALVADEQGSQWVAFPKHSQLENSVFNMVVAGRVAGDDVAIMMVEAEATDNSWNLIKEQGATAPTEEVVAEGLEAAKPFIRTSAAPSPLHSPRLPATVEVPESFLDFMRRTTPTPPSSPPPPRSLPRSSRSPTSRNAMPPPTRSRTRSSPPWPASSRAARRNSPQPSVPSPSRSCASASSRTRSASTAVA